MIEPKTPKALYALSFIDLPEAAQVVGVEWEDFQIEYLNTDSRFASDLKSRQIAWSFSCAVDAIVDSIIRPGRPHIFVSINLNEAVEKIRYARAIYNALPDGSPGKPRIIRDTLTALEFDNGSRLISHPCRDVRGIAQAVIYLDEIAHYPHGLDRLIYTSAVPAITKGDGYLRMGSSPLGAKGIFWEIITQTFKEWKGFKRNIIQWWRVNSFCNNTDLAEIEAPSMPTEERVYKFGSLVLIDIFENMFLEDFQQEYECTFVDETTSWITWEMIKRNQDPDLVYFHAKSVDEAINMIPDIRDAIRKNKIEANLVGGVDIGRTRDLTEFIAVGKTATKQTPVRIMISLDKVKFDDQRDCLIQVINSLPFSNVFVDDNGIGMQLGEELSDHTGKSEGQNFSNANKEIWAVELRLQFERKNIPIPLERDLAYQIHSIKKSISGSKKNVFDNDRNTDKHHADKFWALALANYACSSGMANWADIQDLGNVEGYQNPWK